MAYTQVIPEETDESAISHQLARSSFRLPVMHARLLQVALSQVRRSDKEFSTIEMKTGDILRALGLEDTKQYRDSIRKSVKEIMAHTLDFDTEDGWVQFHFVERSRYIKSRDVIQMRLSDEIAHFALDLGGFFGMISNVEFAKIEGEYAIRLYQLLNSWRDKAGKDGNKPGCWWWEVDIGTLRHLMKVPTGAYSGPGGPSNFKAKVVLGPVKEINQADLGVVVTTEIKKRGGKKTGAIMAVRFNCKLTTKAKPIGKVPSGPEKAVLKNRETKRWKEIFHLLQAQKTLPGFETLDAEERRAMDEVKADQMYAEEQQ